MQSYTLEDFILVLRRIIEDDKKPPASVSSEEEAFDAPNNETVFTGNCDSYE